MGQEYIPKNNDNITQIADLSEANTGFTTTSLTTDVPNISGAEADLQTVSLAPDGTYWIKTGEADTDWEKYLISQNGEYVANIELASTTGIVPPENVLGQVNNTLSIGDGVTIGGQQLLSYIELMKLQSSKPHGYIQIKAAPNGIDDFIIRHNDTTANAGICVSENGGVPTHTAVAPGVESSYAGADANGALVTYDVWIGTSATSGKVSDSIVSYRTNMSNVYSSNLTNCNSLTSIAVSNSSSGDEEYFDNTTNPALLLLNLSNTNITYTNFSNNLLLETLTVNNTPIETIDLSMLSDLDYLGVDDTSELQSLDISNNTKLTNLSIRNCTFPVDLSYAPELFQLNFYGYVGEIDCSNNVVLKQCDGNESTVPVLDFSSCVLTSLSLENANTTDLDISNQTALDYLYCTGGQLSAINAVGFEGTGSSSYYAADFSHNQLTTDAVYDFLDSCATSSPASFIKLGGNPCDGGASLSDGVLHTGADTEDLAATKSYTLVLS